MWKSLLSICLAAVATASPAPEAEADPYLLYGYGGLAHPYTYGYNPYVAHAVVKPKEVEATETADVKKVVSPLVYSPYTYPYGYTGYTGYRHHYIGKREAEAEPEAEADPYHVYGYGGLVHPYTYGYNPYFVRTAVKPKEVEATDETTEVKKVVSPLVYSPYTYPYGYTGYTGYSHHYIGKRDAEAEPEAEADPYLLYGYGGLGHSYAYGGHPYSYGAFPYTYNLAHTVVKPVEAEVDAKTVEEKKEAVPVVHVYGHPYGLGLGYTGLPVVRTVAGKAVVSPTYGLPLHSIGKREAEAEPEADPYYLAYGRPGHHYISGYNRGYYHPRGFYGYPYHGYLG